MPEENEGQVSEEKQEGELDTSVEEAATEGLEGEQEQPKGKAKEEAKAPSATEIGVAVAAALQPQGLSAEQKEAQWQELEAATGFTRQQLIAQRQISDEAALTRSLPLAVEAGTSRAEKILGGSAEMLAKVKDRMDKLPASVRANPEAWEEAAYMVKGRFGAAPTKRNEERQEGKVLGGEKVTTALSEGRSSGNGGKKASKVQYNADEQTIINRYFKGKAEDYEASKERKGLRGREAAGGGTGNAADRALEQMTGGAV